LPVVAMDMLADCGKGFVALRLAFERQACKALQQSKRHLAVIKCGSCANCVPDLGPLLKC